MEWIKPGTNVNFMGWRKPAIAISLLLLTVSFALFLFQGPNLGIDFKGGIEIRVSFSQDPGMDGIRDALKPLGMGEAQIQKFTNIPGKNIYTIQLKGEQEVDVKAADESTVMGDRAIEISETLTNSFPSMQVEIISADVVGDMVGQDLKSKAFWAVLLAMGGILIYVGYRFDFRYSPGAIAALAHDVIITMGVFVAIQHEFNLTTIAALLTIAGYSVNDTIIVFDRIREGRRKYHRDKLVNVVNKSINETLSRTLLSSFTTAIAVLAMFFLGGELLRDFSLAMIVGILVGTYSSIFVASPVFLGLEATFAKRRKRRAR
ncbi:MAG: protein translocase subunit SecF [Candidatus Alcyoniella australis]|nr:protein translocase subunit SecF [Candidatus Alcyoniella australis]